MSVYVDCQRAKLRDDLAGNGVSVTCIGDDITLNMPGNITFDINQTATNSNFYPAVKPATRVVKEFSQTPIDVAGHIDSIGTVAYDMVLSQRRANSAPQHR